MSSHAPAASSRTDRRCIGSAGASVPVDIEVHGPPARAQLSRRVTRRVLRCGRQLRSGPGVADAVDRDDAAKPSCAERADQAFVVGCGRDPRPAVRATRSSRTPTAMTAVQQRLAAARHRQGRDPHARLHHSAGVRLPQRPAGAARVRRAQRPRDPARRGRAGRRDPRCASCRPAPRPSTGVRFDVRIVRPPSAKRCAWRWSMPGRGPMRWPPAPAARSTASSGSTIRASGVAARRRC